MHFNFNFRGIEAVSDIREIVNFIHNQNLGYPGYHDWVQRTEAELYYGNKQAVLAFSDASLVGDLIFQQHKRASGLLELKNLRIHPKFRMRDFARFMLKQVEVEHGSYDALVCDVRTEQRGTIQFLESCGYVQTMVVPLYDDSLEVVMLKVLDSSRQLSITGLAKKVILYQ